MSAKVARNENNAVFVADEFEPRFDAPTAVERAVIEAFVSGRAAREEFGRSVARRLADISGHLSASFEVAGQVFSKLNSAIEDELARNIPTFEPWSEASFQPRILARAFGTVDELDELICRGFGCPHRFELGNGDWSRVKTLEQFLYKCFVSEVSLARSSETPPNVEAAIKIFFPNVRPDLRRMPSHAIVMSGLSGEWEQSLVRIKDGRFDEFFACIASHDRKEEAQVYGDFLAIMPRKEFIQRVRGIEHIKQQHNLENFSRDFRVDSFYRKLDLKSAHSVYSSELDEIIFDKIIRAGLNLDEADFNDVPSKALREKLKVIDEFVDKNPGKPVSALIFKIFPGLNSLAENVGAGLATEQQRDAISGPEHEQHPMLWADRVGRARGQDPIPFLLEQYAAELEGGMTIGQLRMRDDLLGRAVERWAAKHPLPPDLNLDMRTRQQRNDELLRDVDPNFADETSSFSHREQKRLREAARRREK